LKGERHECWALRTWQRLFITLLFAATPFIIDSPVRPFSHGIGGARATSVVFALVFMVSTI
jgi:hypothetical protein